MISNTPVCPDGIICAFLGVFSNSTHWLSSLTIMLSLRSFLTPQVLVETLLMNRELKSMICGLTLIFCSFYPDNSDWQSLISKCVLGWEWNCFFTGWLQLWTNCLSSIIMVGSYLSMCLSTNRLSFYSGSFKWGISIPLGPSYSTNS